MVLLLEYNFSVLFPPLTVKDSTHRWWSYNLLLLEFGILHIFLQTFISDHILGQKATVNSLVSFSDPCMSTRGVTVIVFKYRWHKIFGGNDTVM